MARHSHQYVVRVSFRGADQPLMDVVRHYGHPTLSVAIVRNRLEAGEALEAALRRPSAEVRGPHLPPPDLADPLYRWATTERWV